MISGLYTHAPHTCTYTYTHNCTHTHIQRERQSSKTRWESPTNQEVTAKVYFIASLERSREALQLSKIIYDHSS